MKKFLSIIKAWFLKLLGREKKSAVEPKKFSLSFADKHFPIAPHFPHDTHSKRPKSCKAELLDAAVAKRLRKNAKRLAEAGGLGK